METVKSRIEIRTHSRVIRLHAHPGIVAEVSFEICYYFQFVLDMAHIMVKCYDNLREDVL